MEYWERIFRKNIGCSKWKIPDKAIVNLVPLLKRRKLKRILDLGSGSGRHIVYLSKKGFLVTGLDISSTALNSSQKWLNKEKIKNYCLVEHEIQKLPFPDEHFDAVISINTIYHNLLTDIRKTINEIWRVLKKGGLVLVTILSINDYKFGIGKKLERNTYQERAIHHFFDEKDARKLFSKFKILKIKERAEFKTKKQLVHKQISKCIKKEKVESVYWEILAEK